MKGKIKFFMKSKGYGFITGEDGNDYFLHFTHLKDPKEPYKEQEVEFDIEETDKGLQARNVEIL